MPEMNDVYLYSLYGSGAVLIFIVLGFFFMFDEKDDFSEASPYQRHDHDGEMDYGETTAFIWQYKGILGPAALGFLIFGLVGFGMSRRELDPTDTLVCAVGLSIAVTLVLIYFAHQAEKPAEWSIPIRAAVGKTGTVIATVPARGSGTGAVQVAFGAKMQEYPATTHQDEIPVNATVLIVGIKGNALEVTGSSSYTLTTGQSS